MERNAPARRRLTPALLAGFVALNACTPAIDARGDGVFPPGVDRLATAEDGVEVGHRLINAGEYELAIRAFNRATLDRGATDGEILLGLGTASLGLGRLNQSEHYLRLAIEKDADWPELYNNLGVVLMEQRRTHEAEAMFRKAYALDNGQSEEVRDNLRLALSIIQGSDVMEENDNDYKLVRRGSGDFLIRKIP